jgi:hypothetical protein
VDLSLIGPGLAGLPGTDFWDSLQQRLNQAVFETPLPLLGDQLASEAAGQFAAEIGTSLESFTVAPGASVADVKTSLSSALGARLKTGTGISEFTSGDGTLAKFQLTLAATLTGDCDLNLALGDDPFLEPLIGVADMVAVTADWEFRLTFGVQETAGVSQFFIDTSATDELALGVTASLHDDFAAVGRLGIFSALFLADQGDYDHPAFPSGFSGTYALDLLDSDNHLTPSEYASVELRGEVAGSG